MIMEESSFIAIILAFVTAILNFIDPLLRLINSPFINSYNLFGKKEEELLTSNKWFLFTISKRNISEKEIEFVIIKYEVINSFKRINQSTLKFKFRGVEWRKADKNFSVIKADLPKTVYKGDITFSSRNIYFHIKASQTPIPEELFLIAKKEIHKGSSERDKYVCGQLYTTFSENITGGFALLTSRVYKLHQEQDIEELKRLLSNKIIDFHINGEETSISITEIPWNT